MYDPGFPPIFGSWFDVTGFWLLGKPWESLTCGVDVTDRGETAPYLVFAVTGKAPLWAVPCCRL